ncbi:MAG: 3-deoxy-manno-octulosonate cytidylyltransferase [Planctomycetota bacterium]|nr:MAG: 3-deoxy-manno-octulosonate cytidylyltransferase [Planctomycetota bacterium]
MSSPRPAPPAQAASSGAGDSPRGAVALRSLAVVPARLGSTRLARKMLLAETGMPLFAHTARAVLAAGVVTRVVVATDSDEILAAARASGVEAVMTSSAHKSGTDRVHEAAQLVAADGTRYDVVINVQGDEPELDSGALAGLIALFADPTVEMASLYAPLADAESFTSPNAVKVVVARNGDALYFSRAPIPSRAHPGSTGADGADAVKLHLGVYGFRPAALARFVALPPSALEAAENLEQLRWLDAGHRIRMARASRASRGIDTPEDYAAFVARQRTAGRR